MAQQSNSHIYVPGIDSLRFMAVFVVLIAHWLHAYGNINELPIGSLGVDLFFVISGFLITRILLRYRDKSNEEGLPSGRAVRIFLVRRVLRIFPAYYTIVLITALFNKGLIREAFPWNMSYLTNFFLIDHGEWPRTFGHFWSLAVEEQFYLVWPFLILFLPRKWLAPVLTALVFAAPLTRYVLLEQTGSFLAAKVHTLSCLDALGLGGLMAVMAIDYTRSFDRLIKQRWIGPTVLILALGLIVVPYLQERFELYYVTLRLMASCVFCWVLMQVVYGKAGWWTRILENRFLVMGGKLSYSAYLLHNFVPGFSAGRPFPRVGVASVPNVFGGHVGCILDSLSFC